MNTKSTDSQPAENMNSCETIKETFIPVTRFALIDTLAKLEHDQYDSKEITSIFHCLGQWRHQEHQERLLRLKECYLPFSPDRDTVKVLNHSDQELDQKQEDLLTEIAAILERANYCHLDDNKLDQLLSTHSAHGLELKVDRSEYDAIMVYSRGIGEDILEKRNWKKFFEKEQIVVPTFKRLFLLLKLKPEDERVEEVMKEKAEEFR